MSKIPWPASVDARALLKVKMDLEGYPIKANLFHWEYEFLSDGPAGIIKKTIYFQNIGNNMFNLAFGDWIEDQQKIDDQMRSNNQDRDKVLITVAHCVVDFMQFNPNAIVFAQGSTLARTRLYQMSISKNHESISSLFNIEGYGHGWETFTRGRNYKAFLLKAKEKK